MRHCGCCDKCLFIFLLFSAFLDPPIAWSIFGDNLLQNEALLPQFRALLGLSSDGIKPLECVGEPQEAKLALRMTYRIYRRQASPWLIPKCLSLLIEEVGVGEEEEEVGGGWGEDEEEVWFPPLEVVVGERRSRHKGCVVHK